MRRVLPQPLRAPRQRLGVRRFRAALGQCAARSHRPVSSIGIPLILHLYAFDRILGRPGDEMAKTLSRPITQPDIIDAIFLP